MAINNQTRNELLKAESIAQRKALRVFRIIEQRLIERIDTILVAAEGQPLSLKFLRDRARLRAILDDVTRQILIVSDKLGEIVTEAQRKAIRISRNQTLKLFADVNLSYDSAFFDTQAVQNLAGNAGNDAAVSSLFPRIAVAQRQIIFDVLSEGIGVGDPTDKIIKNLKDSLSLTRNRAATIVRTETLRTYRETTRLAYAESNDVLGWRWVAVLDLRTCVICWSRHGRISPIKRKFATHPNCRCVMIPVFDRKEKFATGKSLFDNLTDPQQKSVLGKGRLDLFKNGTSIDRFVGFRQTEFGGSRFVRSIADTRI